MPDLMGLDLFIHYALRPSICYPYFVCCSFIVSVFTLPVLFSSSCYHLFVCYCYTFGVRDLSLLFCLNHCHVRICSLSSICFWFFIPIVFSFVICFYLFLSIFIYYPEFVNFPSKNGSQGKFLTYFHYLIYDYLKYFNYNFKTNYAYITIKHYSNSHSGIDCIFIISNNNNKLSKRVKTLARRSLSGKIPIAEKSKKRTAYAEQKLFVIFQILCYIAVIFKNS